MKESFTFSLTKAGAGGFVDVGRNILMTIINKSASEFWGT